VDYYLSRLGIVPLDIRIEALMYAQEGSFFIIPGPWFNPDSGDTFTEFNMVGHRQGSDATFNANAINSAFPFYGEPLDIRITMFGAITENLPAAIGDQGAWLTKWGWVPAAQGSTGITTSTINGVTISPQGPRVNTFHGAGNTTAYGDGVGNGIQYIYDPRLAAPYDASGVPLRTNPNFANRPTTLPTIPLTQQEPLPPMPNLPVAPGLLFYGQPPVH
jgi:hypothetical protein